MCVKLNVIGSLILMRDYDSEPNPQMALWAHSGCVRYFQFYMDSTILEMMKKKNIIFVTVKRNLLNIIYKFRCTSVELKLDTT